MNCPHVPRVDSDVFFGTLEAALTRRRIPAAVSLDLTAGCNLRCAHCYIRPLRLPVGRRPRGELGTDQVLALLDAMARAGTLWLLLTGGEPLLRKDFPLIYMHAKRLGIIPTLFTNGTLVSEEIAAMLGEYPPQKAEITVHSMDEATFDRVAGVRGAYRRCRKGIELLLKHRVPLRLKTVAMTLNRGHIPAVRAFARRRGLEYRFDTYLSAHLDTSRFPTRLRLPPDEAVALEFEETKARKSLRRFARELCKPRPESESLYVCGSGLTSCHVDARGRVSPCIVARVPRFDATRLSFASAWSRCTRYVARTCYRSASPCRTCAAMAICGQCPGEAQIEHGNPERPVPDLCAAARERIRRIRLAIPVGDADSVLETQLK